tara:strand:+ start:9533 stop:9871 length:339 start_codon:yes stop_codon:yes gene_type:complete
MKKKRMKKFVMIDEDGNKIVDFNSKTAREAALKAASRDYEHIVLLEDGKLHIFSGYKRELLEEEKNEFTRTNKILSKPIATKLISRRLDRLVDLKKKEDKEYIREKLQDFTS